MDAANHEHIGMSVHKGISCVMKRTTVHVFPEPCNHACTTVISMLYTLHMYVYSDEHVISAFNLRKENAAAPFID
jgi:hypothetical protein